ncbi:MAG TPA: acyl-CoA dehydrogenase family protein, partial [Candidatus Binatia bacterium]|nr:acyl-CoA dehydrogenase family protein [Candidatus Binatia bacterium]
MDFNLTEEQQQIRDEVRKVCREFPDTYWREVDKQRGYPDAFVKKLTELGWLAALIPEEYGGSGLGITEGSIILEEINRSGGSATACHAQMYTMGTLLRHGGAEQKKRYLPKVASGELRLQAFGVTEPNAGSETTRIETFATKRGDKYVINGQKIFISRVLESDLMLL